MAERPLERPGRLGIFLQPDPLTAEEIAELARRAEAWGYSILWLPEAIGRDPFVLIGFLAARTERLILGTAIANIYARDAMAMKAACKTAAGVAPGRFVLGLGVSSPRLVEGVRGHTYGRPVATMRSYLEAMDAALFRGTEPEVEAPILLGALGPAMTRLAGAKSRGAIPYLVPPEHTARSREILGEGPWLCPEQAVLLETDPRRAREVAAKAIASYLTAPGYRNNLERMGFSEAEMDEPADRLVDALVAWGDAAAIRSRIEAHFAAGADHVCLQALRPDGERGVDVDLLERLAPGSQT